MRMAKAGHTDEEDAARERALTMLPDVSRETIAQLDALAALVKRWTQKINLVSRSDADKLWSRHILDSLGLASDLEWARIWADLGAGGGFPALPLAILAKTRGRDVAFHLYESDKRKAAFLLEAARRFELPVTVHAQRIEDADLVAADVISARALAGVTELLELAKLFHVKHQGAPGVLTLLKGDGAYGELTDAARSWHMRYQAERHPLTLKGYILRLQEFSRADDR